MTLGTVHPFGMSCERLVLSIVRGPPPNPSRPSRRRAPREAGIEERGLEFYLHMTPTEGGSPRFPICDSALPLDMARYSWRLIAS